MAAEMVGRLLSNYRIIRPIGAGGMGEVYLAEDTRLERPVALKILPAAVAADADRMRRFAREAKAASAIDHPNIIHVYEIGHADGFHFIAMQYVEGETLDSRIGGRPLATEELLATAIQITDAVAEAHSRGIIHRDLKPANIMVSAKGHAKVLDFGLARIHKAVARREDHEQPTQSMTEAGVVMGTLGYMSPEQALGKALDHRTDLFSLGVVFYEMATGMAPFAGTNAIETIDRIVHRQPDSIARLNYDLPQEAERIIRKCLEKSPESRYQSASEILIDLRNLLRDLGSLPSRVDETAEADAPQATPEAGARSPWRNRLIAAAAVLVVLVITAVVADRFRAERGGAPLPRSTPSSLTGWFFERAGEDAEEPGATATVGEGVVAGASVAVLPFTALSSGADDGYFADGLTEEIINALAALPDLLVTARTSAFYFRGKNVPISEIAAHLGVAHIVEGSVRRSGDRARITAQLIRAADGFHLWSATYDHLFDDTFAVQTRIAESVAGALGVLLDERQRAAMVDVGVRDVEAFVAYQRGVEFFNRAHNEGPMLPMLARANAAFDVATARKKDFAHAHFQHADYYAHLLIDEAPGAGQRFVSADGVGVDEAARRLSADFEAAYRYERDPGQRLVIQTVQTTVSSDWRNLKEQITRAFGAWDNCRHGLWIDQTAIVFGYGEAALAHDLRRTRCDPLGGNWTRLAITAVWIGRPLEGLEYADRIEALRGQDRDVMHARILAYLALGRLDEAEALFAAGRFGSADVSESMSLLAFQIPAAAGRREEWERLRPSLDRDPGRLLVGAAVFGDRTTANRAAAEIDAMTLGPAILLRVADRCGCGSPFDLEATPIFARLLREGDLPWSPPAPIRFPLKNW